MPLTLYEHYACAAGYFFGGMLSTVCSLWLLFEFFPMLRMGKSQRMLHYNLTIANLLTVSLFIFGTTSHFEQQWYFSEFWCQLYVFVCKLAPVLAMYLCALTCYAENKLAEYSKRGHTLNQSFKSQLFLCYAVAFFFGSGALSWAKYGKEPTGFTCTVIWYEIQPYVNVLITLGFGLPSLIALYYAQRMWSNGLLEDNPLAKSVAIMSLTLPLQYIGFAIGYVLVLLGLTIPLQAMAIIPLWTKLAGLIHPFVYSNCFSSGESATPVEPEKSNKTD